MTDELRGRTALDESAVTNEILEDAIGDPEDLELDEHNDEGAAAISWSRVESAARIFASVSVAIAALVGVWQYVESNREIKRERSLEYVRLWRDGEPLVQFTNVQRFLEVRIAESDQSFNELEKLSKDVRTLALGNFGARVSLELKNSQHENSQQIANAIHRLTLFFGQIEICIDSNLCDAKVLESYLGDEVRSFWLYFKGFAQVRRENNYPGYGGTVDSLVARFEAIGKGE